MDLSRSKLVLTKQIGIKAKNKKFCYIIFSSQQKNRKIYIKLIVFKDNIILYAIYQRKIKSCLKKCIFIYAYAFL